MRALVWVLCRRCEPSSELHIAEHFYRQSALADLLGVPCAKVNEDRLYRALDRLLPHKEALECHLKERLGALFGLEYDLFLYDVTSTYFEGEARDAFAARLETVHQLSRDAGSAAACTSGASGWLPPLKKPDGDYWKKMGMWTLLEAQCLVLECEPPDTIT
ncbi:MAG: hypothetical protein HY706_14795 [Candidatus Hydrogenedentes bacterium]|nr:hypothetical protein [Candidatus Hydrogenedentota bacterium]